MPYQIRPVRETSDNIPALFSNPLSLMLPKSVIQNRFDEGIVREAKKKVFDKKSKEILMTIWNNKNSKNIEAQKVLKVSDIVYPLPEDVSNYDVVKLVTDGLITNKGNRHVAFTNSGKMALGIEIMEQQSEFEKNKTKQKFVFSQAVGGIRKGPRTGLPQDDLQDKIPQLEEMQSGIEDREEAIDADMEDFNQVEELTPEILQLLGLETAEPQYSDEDLDLEEMIS